MKLKKIVVRESADRETAGEKTGSATHRERNLPRLVGSIHREYSPP